VQRHTPLPDECPIQQTVSSFQNVSAACPVLLLPYLAKRFVPLWESACDVASETERTEKTGQFGNASYHASGWNPPLLAKGPL